MKKLILFAFASFITFSACQKASQVGSTGSDDLAKVIEKTFTAQCESKVKTALNNTSVMWQSGDMITILWDGGSVDAAASPYNYNSSAEFTVTVDEASEYFAVYPAGAENTSGEGLFTVTIPEKQVGTFADASILCAKATDDCQLAFKHLAGYLEFTTDTPGVVTVSGSSSSYIAGDVTVTGFDANGIPQYTPAPKHVSVSVDAKSSGTYYLALLPEAKLDFLSITLVDGSVKHYALSTNGIHLNRGKVVGLGNITGKLTDKPLYPVFIEDFDVLVEFDFEF